MAKSRNTPLMKRTLERSSAFSYIGEEDGSIVCVKSATQIPAIAVPYPWSHLLRVADGVRTFQEMVTRMRTIDPPLAKAWSNKHAKQAKIAVETLLQWKVLVDRTSGP